MFKEAKDLKFFHRPMVVKLWLVSSGDEPSTYFQIRLFFERILNFELNLFILFNEVVSRYFFYLNLSYRSYQLVGRSQPT